MDIARFLKLMVEKEASDLFLTTGAPVYLKVDGKLRPCSQEDIKKGMIRKVTYALLSEEQAQTFDEENELSVAISVKSVGRFRFNFFRQRGEVGIVVRHIPSRIPSVEELNMPPLLNELIMAPRGLILVVGAAGSGKSTTLASMIDWRNRHVSGHILTIEDPIEYLHRHQQSIVNQREIGFDTHSYQNALKAAMREAPDVILIGEILDTDTMQAAMSYAETGHLCLATLHAANADQTLGRILNFFPQQAHSQILMDLSLNLNAIVSQRLVKLKNGKRKPAAEILINTPRMAEMIKNGELDRLKEAMEKSLDAGMGTFDQSLYELYRNDEIELGEALHNADSRDGLELRIKLTESGSQQLQGITN